MEADSAEPESPLPSGWTRGVDQGSGRTFYIDHNSRTTSWVRPEVSPTNLKITLDKLSDSQTSVWNVKSLYIIH